MLKNTNTKKWLEHCVLATLKILAIGILGPSPNPYCPKSCLIFVKANPQTKKENKYVVPA